MRFSPGCRVARAVGAAIAAVLATAAVAVVRWPAEPPPPGFVVARSGHLVLDGQAMHVVGINAYSLATDYARNRGCGTPPSSPGELLDTVPAGSVVRFWAFQQFAISNRGLFFDWGPLDAVVAEAAARGVKLVMTLSDQAGTCADGHWHDSAWYAGDYRQRYGSGAHADLVSYADWVQLIVSRYALSLAVAYWEPVNEPEASDCNAGSTGPDCIGHDTCPPRATAVLRQFFDQVGGLIHRLDRWHGVGEGTIGAWQCGLAGAGFGIVGRSPGVDVLTVHDYSVGNDRWVLDRLDLARQLRKPLLVEETGIEAGTGSCATPTERAARLKALTVTDLTAGIAGVLFWNWWTGPVSACDYALPPGDPALVLVGPALRPA